MQQTKDVIERLIYFRQLHESIRQLALNPYDNRYSPYRLTTKRK